MLKSEFCTYGNWLFKRRSYLPLFMFGIGIALMAYSAKNATQRETLPEQIFEYVCFAISLLGLALRMYVLGTVPEKTSGRNTNSQVAEVLNTEGVYSVVRHPLYVGNFFIYLGLSLYPGFWWFPILFCLLFWIYYERIMFAEEDFLERKFGEAYRVWADRTPAFFPRMKQWQRPGRRFSIWDAVRRDRSAILGIALGFSMLEAAEHITIGEVFADDWIWVAISALGLSLYAAGKMLIPAVR
jgi:protein-S-isoprenylcysteine O-methyltransferase Ste14